MAQLPAGPDKKKRTGLRYVRVKCTMSLGQCGSEKIKTRWRTVTSIRRQVLMFAACHSWATFELIRVSKRDRMKPGSSGDVQSASPGDHDSGTFKHVGPLGWNPHVLTSLIEVLQHKLLLFRRLFQEPPIEVRCPPQLSHRTHLLRDSSSDAAANSVGFVYAARLLHRCRPRRPKK